VEDDKSAWMTWIPFVEYVINTRTHTSTKFSPFELLYGVRPNEFIDYNPDNELSEEESLYNRTIQLRQLIEIDRPKAITNIAEGKERQKITQDKRSNVGIETLKPGTSVRVALEGNKTKLDPEFSGRFKIHRVTSGGNNILTTPDGFPEQKAIPAHKLPIIEDDDDEYESWEIKAIHGERKIGEQLQYFTQWKTKNKKGKPIMEWIDVDDLEDAKEAISNYLESKRKRDKEDEKERENDENHTNKEKNKNT